MASPAASTETSEESGRSPHYDTRLPPLTRWQRMQVPLLGWAGYWLIAGIGRTMRFEVLGWQHVDRVLASGRRCIYAFWHRTSISSAWYWRQRGVVVMNSTNFDGQWTRRIVERLGFGTAQGSSTRGGLRGLVEMWRRLAEGRDVAFTIDGPRGPRYVAKPGPVMLARRSGHPVVCFHIGLENAYTFQKAWDLFQIPHPFSRAVITVAPPVEVPESADEALLEKKHSEMQAGLDRAREAAEAWFRLSPEKRDAMRQEWNR